MSIAERAKRLYELELKDRLIVEHFDKFVAIEPTSKDYFVGNTFMDAALAGKAAYPDGKLFVLRVGHDAAVHIGATRS